MFRITTRQTSERLRAQGFTLVETLVAIAVLAILASLAAPGFAEAIRRHRVESMREQMLASIALAKVEALARGQQAVMTRTTPCPQAAANTDWDCGWSVFMDLNGDSLRNAGEPVVHEVHGKAGTRIRRGPVVASASFNRLGLPQPARIEIFPAGPNLGVADGLILCVARSGRVRTLRGVDFCP